MYSCDGYVAHGYEVRIYSRQFYCTAIPDTSHECQIFLVYLCIGAVSDYVLTAGPLSSNQRYAVAHRNT